MFSSLILDEAVLKETHLRILGAKRNNNILIIILKINLAARNEICLIKYASIFMFFASNEKGKILNMHRVNICSFKQTVTVE